MKKKKIDWNVIAYSINTWLNQNALHNKRFTTHELVANLEKCGFKSANKHLTDLVKADIIHVEKKGTTNLYWFEGPIYQVKLHNVMTSIKEKVAAKQRDYYAKRKGTSEPVPEKVELTEEVAIEFLKKTGNYQILKKTVSWEEI